MFLAPSGGHHAALGRENPLIGLSEFSDPPHLTNNAAERSLRGIA
jgi:hypothetical protein